MKPLAVLSIALLSGLLSAADLPHLEWKPDSVRLLQPGATYGRIKRLGDNSLLCCFEKQGKSWTARSSDNGATWSEPVLVGAFPSGAAANPEICALDGPGALLFWNERPRPEGGPARFGIRVAATRDGGRTWQVRSEPVYQSGNTASEGCWEPAAIRLPDRTLRLFFAHELPGQQEIASMVSKDNGATWSAPRQASLRARHRDGMPVPLLLKDNRLVFSIEDNGVASKPGAFVFRPTLIEPFPTSVDADSKRRWPALGKLPEGPVNIAASYLARLPSGEVLLSAQSNEDENRWHRAVVYVGDANAKNFANRSLPFGLPPDTNCEWNSLFVKDNDTVVLLSHASINGQRGLWSAEAKIIRPASR